VIGRNVRGIVGDKLHFMSEHAYDVVRWLIRAPHLFFLLLLLMTPEAILIPLLRTKCCAQSRQPKHQDLHPGSDQSTDVSQCPHQCRAQHTRLWSSPPPRTCGFAALSSSPRAAFFGFFDVLMSCQKLPIALLLRCDLCAFPAGLLRRSLTRIALQAVQR
jgi:hypothetical protein